MKNREILRNKTVYLRLSMLDLSNILMHEFWYDYVETKYNENAKLRYMGTDNFIAYIKANDIYKDIAEDNKTRFDTSNYELGGKVMTKFVGLRAITYSYLIDDGSKDKKAKGKKNCITKKKLKF